MAAINEFFNYEAKPARKSGPARWLVNARAWLARRRQRRQELRLLSYLSERDIQELGTSRAQLEFEVRKGDFWKF